jgi:hypothetical protein
LIRPHERSVFPFLPRFGPFRDVRAAMNAGAYLKPHLARLYVALLVSCLLHAALVFMPWLGANVAVSWPAMRGGQKAGPAQILNATLVLESGPAAEVTADFSGAAGAADAPAQPMDGEEPRPALDRAVGIGLLPIPAPTYYTTDQLTKRPQPTFVPQLTLPQELEPMFGSGKVVLKLWIDELGNVNSVDVDESNLPEAVAKTAAEAFGNLHFVPGEIDGRRVGVVMKIEVTYDDSGKRPGSRFTPRRR